MSWSPSPDVAAASNLAVLMDQVGVASYADLHRWSVENRAEFWAKAVEQLGVVFAERGPILDATGTWFPQAHLNIVDSCFTAPANDVAVVHRRDGVDHAVTYGELASLIGAAAKGIGELGVVPGDRVAIAMPMTLDAVVAYLAIASLGGVAVSIADSFAPAEIATRLRIASCDLVVTSAAVRRSGKVLPMYEKVVAADVQQAIVVDDGDLRPGDVSWTSVTAVASEPAPVVVPGSAYLNVLFSSGTTGDPKAIPWTHLTPIKAAMDGRFHQDIQPGDVVAWPTNLGWMMGPWLIFASLLNGATMALYDDAPNTIGFSEFVADTGVTMLGVVPSLVAAWRAADATAAVDWSAVRCFSSTGEAANPDDMAWLAEQAGGKPVIEYCGGTEIGGGYITGTVVQEWRPGLFSTPALGLDVLILDEAGRPASEGELFIVGSSVGLSTELLNRDHNEVYYEGVPRPGLRRHGDHMERLPDGYYRALGRVDDTMNLGGIKVSSAEIERVLSPVVGVRELAAVAVDPPGGGPSELVVFVVPEPRSGPTGNVDVPLGEELSDEEVVQPREAAAGFSVDEMKEQMQALLRDELNPLFKVSRVEIIDELPRTASAKVMRRELRTLVSSGGNEAD